LKLFARQDEFGHEEETPQGETCPKGNPDMRATFPDEPKNLKAPLPGTNRPMPVFQANVVNLKDQKSFEQEREEERIAREKQVELIKKLVEAAYQDETTPSQGNLPTTGFYPNKLAPNGTTEQAPQLDQAEIQKKKEEKVAEEKRHEEEMRKLREQERLQIEKPKGISITFGFGSLSKQEDEPVKPTQMEEEIPAKKTGPSQENKPSQPVLVSFQRAKLPGTEMKREVKREFKFICGVCRKGFFDEGMLQTHERVSNLHKENLLKQQSGLVKKAHFLFPIA
jgi:hypothetical protein